MKTAKEFLNNCSVHEDETIYDTRDNIVGKITQLMEEYAEMRMNDHLVNKKIVTMCSDCPFLVYGLTQMDNEYFECNLTNKCVKVNIIYKSTPENCPLNDKDYLISKQK